MFYKVIFQVKTIHSSSVSILMGATMDLQGKKVQSRGSLGNARLRSSFKRICCRNIVDRPPLVAAPLDPPRHSLWSHSSHRLVPASDWTGLLLESGHSFLRQDFSNSFAQELPLIWLRSLRTSLPSEVLLTQFFLLPSCRCSLASCLCVSLLLPFLGMSPNKYSIYLMSFWHLLLRGPKWMKAVLEEGQENRQ